MSVAFWLSYSSRWMLHCLQDECCKAEFNKATETQWVVWINLRSLMMTHWLFRKDKRNLTFRDHNRRYKARPLLIEFHWRHIVCWIRQGMRKCGYAHNDSTIFPMPWNFDGNCWFVRDTLGYPDLMLLINVWRWAALRRVNGWDEEFLSFCLAYSSWAM
jgi:hypothetical protein